MTTTATRKFIIDPAHSSVEFVVRHLVISKVRGSFRVVSGSLELSDSSAVPVSVSAEIDASSIDTREPQRDGHLKSEDFLHVEKHSHLRFASTKIEATGDTTFTITGDLTLRGVTKSVTLSAEVDGRTTDPWGNDRVAYSASGKINRKDFGLNWSQALETGGLMVGDEVTIELSIQAIPAP